MKKEGLLLSIIIIILLTCRVGIVDGTSMYPTLHSQTPFIYTQFIHPPKVERFSIITFKDPVSDTLLVKRVVGIQGDTVYLHRGNVVGVNEYLLPNVYLSKEEFEEVEVFKVLPGTVYYIGDNQDNSIDSRHKGLLPVDNIIGKVILGG